MSEYKTCRKTYTAWDYKAEIDELNRMSEQGWQLVKGGLFSRKYKKNENVVYKYQLDYQDKIDDKALYIETFREQGWEYVDSTGNGWTFFRKIYNPSLPAENYEIYTDKESLKEMKNKWIRLGTIVSIVLGLDAIMIIVRNCQCFTIPRTIVSVAITAEFFWILFGILKMKRNNYNGKSFNARIFLAILFGSFLLYFLADSARIDFNSNTKAEYYAQVTKDSPVNFYEDKVTYPDFYSLEINGKIEAPLSLVIENTKTGDVVLKTTLNPDAQKSVDYKSGSFFLKPGTYAIKYTNYAGGMMDLHFDWD